MGFQWIRRLASPLGLALAAVLAPIPTAELAADVGAGDRSPVGVSEIDLATQNQSQSMGLARRAAIWNRGRRIPPKVRARTELGLEEVTRQVDIAATKNLHEVVRRLGAELGLPIRVLHAERRETGARWSDLLIAHTLELSAADPPSATQLFKLHDDGLGWSQVAYGLGLDLEQFLTTVRIEGRVLAGHGRPDGRITVVRMDPSFRAAAEMTPSTNGAPLLRVEGPDDRRPVSGRRSGGT